MQTPIPPFTEPWRTTALRTGSLALIVGAVAGVRARELAVVPQVTVLALWFTLGGHYFELLCRNRLRQHLGDRPSVQLVARLLVWFLGGLALFAGAMATRALLTGQTRPPMPWWAAGLAFVGAELLVHLGLRMLGRPNLFDGRG